MFFVVVQIMVDKRKFSSAYTERERVKIILSVMMENVNHKIAHNTNILVLESELEWS